MNPSSITPKVLLVCTCHWVSSARLAGALVAAGCEVEAVCPRGHPLTAMRASSRRHPYRALTPLRSIAAAIEAARPSFVIPCDDLATTHLHRLYDRALLTGDRGAAMRTLLEHSLGDPAGFAITTARVAFMTVGHKLGIRVPITAATRTADELRHWVRQNGLPAVVKADGTYGGRGVRIAQTEAEAVEAFDALSAPPSPPHALKRAVINRDFSSIVPCAWRLRSAISVQRFVAGRDANSTVACRHGEVVASITATVLHTLGENGPASVLQLIDTPEIARALDRIVRELKLSGLVGFDFIIEEQTGAPYLIEMNPRATQVCHLNLGPGRDLAGSLRAMLSGEPIREVPRVTESDIIALFPQEWLRDPASHFLTNGYHDVPWEEPDLIRACLRADTRSRIWSILASSWRPRRSSRGLRSARTRCAAASPSLRPHDVWRLFDGERRKL